MVIALLIVILIASFVIAGQAKKRAPTVGFGRIVLIWILSLLIPTLFGGLSYGLLAPPSGGTDDFTWYLARNHYVSTLNDAMYVEEICLRALGMIIGIFIAWVVSISLAPGRASEPEGAPEVILCECEDSLRAGQTLASLRSAGIDSRVVEPGWSWIANAQRPHIMVAASQLDQARNIIALGNFDAPVCPKCGAADPVLEDSERENVWRCESCGAQWTEPIAESN